MNRKEFEQQVQRLRPLMLRVGRDFFGNKDDAEDVAQDSLVRLWNYCERLDANRNLEALAVMVAKNICVEKFKRRTLTIVELPDDKLGSEADQADAGIISTETRELIDEAIDTLSPREQQLVRKRYLEDHSAEEIAQETGIPKPSVKSMLSMAKAKLKKRLRR
ncbi:MAG: sigma-70 family RNA polymerase sigma factor [Bacteroidales bacterium]|nr:sigma-70 family RNA polymerase sigma factor [Bacteroidales bacterium]